MPDWTLQAPVLHVDLGDKFPPGNVVLIRFHLFCPGCTDKPKVRANLSTVLDAEHWQPSPRLDSEEAGHWSFTQNFLLTRKGQSCPPGTYEMRFEVETSLDAATGPGGCFWANLSFEVVASKASPDGHLEIRANDLAIFDGSAIPITSFGKVTIDLAGKSIASLEGVPTANVGSPAIQQNKSYGGRYLEIRLKPDLSRAASYSFVSRGVPPKASPVRGDRDDGAICLDWQQVLDKAACATGMAGSADGELLVTLDENNAVQIWPVGDLERHVTIRPDNQSGHLQACAVRGRKGCWQLWLGLRNAVEIWRVYEKAGAKRDNVILEAECQQKIDCEELVDIQLAEQPKLVAMMTSAGSVYLRKAEDGKFVDRFDVGQPITSGSFCDEGRYVIVGTRQGKTIEWDRKNLRQSLELSEDHDGRRVSLVSGLSAKRLYFSAGEEGTVALREVGSGRIGKPLVFGVAVTCGSWDKDGRVIVVGLNDRTLIAKDLLIGQERWRRLLTHIPSAIVSLDARLLAVANRGGAVELCNALTGQPVATLVSFGGGWLAISADQRLGGEGYERFIKQDDRKHRIAGEGFSVSRK